MGEASMRKWMRRAWVALEPVRAKYGHPGPESIIQFPVRRTALRMRREHRLLGVVRTVTGRAVTDVRWRPKGWLWASTGADHFLLRRDATARHGFRAWRWLPPDIAAQIRATLTSEGKGWMLGHA